jgi:hypothetical protein
MRNSRAAPAHFSADFRDFPRTSPYFEKAKKKAAEAA